MTIPKLKPAAHTMKFKSAENVRLDQDESEGESDKNLQAKQKPQCPPLSTAGLDQHLHKCMMCDQCGHGCHTNLKAMGPLSACFQCYNWKLGCSLAAHLAKDSKMPAGPSTKTNNNTTILEVGKAPLVVVQEHAKEKPAPKKHVTHNKLM
jgi:hypothetical protein